MKNPEKIVGKFKLLTEYDVSKGGQLNESGYARTANTIRGIVPYIDTF